MTIQEQDEGQRRVEEGHALMMLKSALFHVDGRMVASTDPLWVQSEFDTLTWIFDLLGLRTNICKIVGVLCRPCRAAEVRADEAYTRQVIGEGRVFKERQRERVICPEYGN